MTPTTTPMTEQRTLSQTLENQSRMPFAHPPPSTRRSEMARSWRSSATISGTAKMPRPTMTSFSPSTR